MKKRLAAIALTALLISAAGCNTNSNTQISSSDAAVSISESNEFQSFIEQAEQTDTKENSAKTSETSKDESSKEENSKDESSVVTTEFTSNTNGKIDTTDLFSNRDLAQTADTSDAQTINVSDGQTINITEAGTYIISGTASTRKSSF